MKNKTRLKEKTGRKREVEELIAALLLSYTLETGKKVAAISSIRMIDVESKETKKYIVAVLDEE